MAKPAALAVAVLCAAGLAACGSSSRSSGGDSATTTGVPKAPAQAAFPAADGKIAFRRYFDADQTSGAVFTIDPDGTHERQVTKPPPQTVDAQPAWSPDGKLIAFARCRADKPWGIWPAPPDGSGAHAVFQCRKALPAT